MKNGILVMLLAVSVTTASGQTWKEWFKQKKTQQKYLIEQIVALQVYLGYMRKGYDIVKDGTSLISDITGGEWSLHKDYFGSLKTVSPCIKQYERIVDIVAIEAYLLKSYPEILRQAGGQLTPEEITQVAAVYSGLMKAAATDLEELLLVATSGKLEMSDDERLKRIEAIYERSREKKVFFTRFAGHVFALAVRRTARAKESDLLRKLYGGRHATDQ